jgi:acyl carrier protein
VNEVEERTVMSEAELKALLKQEIERLKEGAIRAEEIDDDEPLFSIPGECESRIELDSLDALELAFAVEQATGIAQPQDWDYRELLTIRRVQAYSRSLAGEHYASK